MPHRLRPPLRALLAATVVLQIIYVVNLFLSRVDPGVAADAVLSMLAEWFAVLTCWVAVALGSARRLVPALAATAVTATVIGDTLFLTVIDGSGSAPFPALADYAYLVFYVVMLLAIVMLARQHLASRNSVVIFDVIVGSLGAASILALVLTPVLDAATIETDPFASFVSVGYPVLDVLLIASIVGLRASDRSGAPWSLLVVGLLLFTAADVVYALQLPDDGYVVGTSLDAAWGVGVLFMTFWVCQATVQPEITTRRAFPTKTGTALAVTAIVGALSVLVISPMVSGSLIAVVLAATALASTVAPIAIRRGQLERDRNRDPLTGLRNRLSLTRAADRDLSAKARAVVILVGLDDLDEVNLGLDHDAGDQFVTRLRGIVEGMLPAGALAGRMSDNEFAIVLPGVGREAGKALATRLQSAISEPVVVAGVEIMMTTTTAIAEMPEDGHDFASLIRHAGAALRRTRESRNLRRKNDDQPRASPERLRTLHELRSSLGHDHIVLVYQPKLRIASNTIDGVEALARWNHPTRGLLGPHEFIPLLDDAGYLSEWTVRIIAEALDQAARWAERGTPLTVAVNVSGRSLSDPALIDAVLPLLAYRSLPPSTLTLEVTEESLVGNASAVMSAFQPLRDVGVRLSLDDFGTGYNSLTSLHDLVVDELKIDRSFVAGLAANARSRALVRASIALADELEMDTVAEGVEAAATFAALAEMGCAHAQGYLISKPVPAREIDALLPVPKPLSFSAGDTVEIRSTGRRGVLIGGTDDDFLQLIMNGSNDVAEFPAPAVRRIGAHPLPR